MQNNSTVTIELNQRRCWKEDYPFKEKHIVRRLLDPFMRTKQYPCKPKFVTEGKQFSLETYTEIVTERDIKDRIEKFYSYE